MSVRSSIGLARRAFLGLAVVALPLDASAQPRDFKAAIACLDDLGLSTQTTRMPASNGSVEVFKFPASTKTTMMLQLTSGDVVKGAVMLVQAGGDLTSAVTVFSMLGGCLVGVDRKLVLQTMLRPGIVSIGGAYFLHQEGAVQTMAMAWTKEDVKRLAK